MKSITLFLALAGLVFHAHAVQSDSSAIEETRNRRLRAELKAAEAREVELLNAVATLEESIRVSSIAAELMDGTRTAPPRPRVVETQIYEDGVAAPVFFDSTDGKAKNKDTWLKLKPGSLYRFEGEVKVEGLTGTKGVKFGAYAPVKGAATRWPDCGSTGAGTFDWQTVQFSYRMPHGGSFMLSIGPAGGKGKVWVRNIRGYEVTEVEE